jgi:hypothetical protein
LFISNTGKLIASYGDGQENWSVRSKTGSTTLQSNTWYHVAAVLRDAGNISLYINGQDDGGVSGGSGGPIVYSNDTDSSSQIGCRNGTEYFLYGAVDDVRVYNRALSPHEIQVLATN